MGKARIVVHSLLTMRGANTRFVQRIMRHSDPRMTERYTHLDPAYLHGEMDALMRFSARAGRATSPGTGRGGGNGRVVFLARG